MDKQKIKELVSIRSDEINSQIHDIKDTYNIEVTNELLEQLVEFSFNAIDYYNEKYNYFKKDDYGNLYMFNIKQSNYYHYNILTSALYNNMDYKSFKKSFDMTDNNLYKFYIALSDILCDQIYIKTNKNTYCEIYNEDTNIKIIFEDFSNIKLPYQQKCLLITYLFYYNQNTDKVIQLIEQHLSNLTNHFEFLEQFLFNYNDIYKKTNSNIELYLEAIVDCDDIIESNIKNHIKILNFLKKKKNYLI